MGHVSEKTDAYAFGVVICELLTGRLAGNPMTGALLSTDMLPVVSDAPRLLQAQLDTKAGDWGSPEVLEFAKVARKCLNPSARTRASAKDVRPELDRLAGRLAFRRAEDGKEFDTMTGKLVPKAPKPLVAERATYSSTGAGW